MGPVVTETNFQRDDRIRREEARLVRMEESLSRIEEGQKAESVSFTVHMKDDDQRFQSIDSRLIGLQTQLTGIHDTLKIIDERGRNQIETNSHLERRIAVVEKYQSNQSNIAGVLFAQWKVLSGGIAFGLTLASLIVILATYF